MIELFGQTSITSDRQSSKGNQLKWYNEKNWYKADYAGYEGLAEYVVSNLLTFSNLQTSEFTNYQTETIVYKEQKYQGCSSQNFMPEGWQLITLERLFQNMYGKSLYKSIYTIEDTEARLVFLVNQVEQITGLKEFGIYMSKLLTIDALFLNEDRHMHNIAVLIDNTKKYHYCPIFDNGGALLSDTMMDYPLHGDLSKMLTRVAAKTIHRDFDEQLDAAEKLYGQHIRFHFDRKDVKELLREEPYYSQEAKDRVLEIVMNQRRKYAYLFA